MTPDLTTSRRVHVVGAGGAGMGAIASVLSSMGHSVTGSDLKDGPVVQRLVAAGIPVTVGHDSSNIGDAEMLAISTAIPDRNPEVRAAIESGVPVLRRAEILPAIAATRRTIAVAGTHGKTTTSSMLSLVMVEANLSPSFIIGGDVNEIGTGAAWDEGEWLVIEADESDRTFLSLGAELALVTNVEPDHLGTYGGDPDNLRAAFHEFATQARTCIACADDAGAAEVAAAAGAVTYGLSPGADYRLTDLVKSRSSIAFTLVHLGEEMVRIDLPTPGLHNALNAAAAVVTGSIIGAPVDAAARALSRFGGVARRFEFRGEASGIVFVDDYAHLPTEIDAAIAAARDGQWDRIVCVFQPHRFSRTAALWKEFGRAFNGADQLVVTEIYPAGETPRPGVTAKLIVDSVLDADPDFPVVFQPRLADAADWLASNLRSGDLCLTLGAGDLTALPDVLVERIGAGSSS